MSSIKLIQSGAIAQIRIDNPSKLNILNSAMLQQLDAHCSTIERDENIRAVLITASEAKFFCAGADIKEWGQLNPRQFSRIWVREGHRIFDRLANLPIPTIAVLEGSAFGGGLELAGACDMRVVSTETKLGLPETSVGTVPGWSGTQRLAKLIPLPILKEMALAGTHLDAERAVQLGVANYACEDPMQKANQLANSILEKGPQATETAKFMLSIAADEAVEANIEALAGSAMAASPECEEGVSAFAQKRAPNFNQEDK